MTFVGKTAIITGAVGILDTDAERSATHGRSFPADQAAGANGRCYCRRLLHGLARTSFVTGETLIVGGFPLRPLSKAQRDASGDY